MQHFFSETESGGRGGSIQRANKPFAPPSSIMQGGKSPSALAACSSSTYTFVHVGVHELVGVKECSADAFIHAPCVWSPASAYSGGFPFERVCLHRMYGQPWGFEGGGRENRIQRILKDSQGSVETSRTSCGKRAAQTREGKKMRGICMSGATSETA